AKVNKNGYSHATCLCFFALKRGRKPTFRNFCFLALKITGMRFFREKQLLSILLLLGVAIRVFQFLVPRSFYHDEALLAQNILDLSFPKLTGALLFNQAAPFGFLWLTKALVSLLGNYEYVFHLIPAISGIVALFIFHKIARQLLPPTFALIALAFFVFNDHLIFYAHAFKQYESDVLTGLILTAGFLHFSQTRSTLKKWLMGGFIAAILVYFSQPSIFFLVGGTLVLGFLFWSKQQYGALKSLLLAAGIWGASFLVYFFFFLRPSLSNNFLQNYHADYYMPLSFWNWESLRWYARTFIGFYDNPGAIHFNIGGAIFGLAGIVWNIWKKSPKYLMLLMPFLLAVGASAFGKYSTIGRLFLFAVPAIIIFMVKGIELFAHFLSRWSPKYGPLISYAFAGILMLQSFLNNAIH
ncbi:MAG: hypothetical protein D6714_18540, partial [Bacteroidetes bacterium]